VVAAPDSAEDWLRLTLTPGVGLARQRALLTAFGLPEAIFSSGSAAAVKVAGDSANALFAHNPARDALVAKTLDWLLQPDCALLTLADQRYPAALFDLPDPPTVLYLRGQTAALRHPGLAIIGSRNCTAGGAANAQSFAQSLCAAGWTIVSGLALGIDGAAHQGAIRAGGRTIAVLGTGIDRIYPARHRALAHELIRNGAILSELPLGTPAAAHHFPRRNRLIAALSRGVLVVEAATESGSLITARLAGELGREVLAIPGSIHSPLSRGCHRLLRQGATLVESIADIANEFEGRYTRTEAPINAEPATNNEEPLLAAMGFDPVDADTLVFRCGLTTESVLAMLSELEIDGRVAAIAGGRFQRVA
jgi:DNA processing protein